jgi:uncharacterized protein (DUF488 family)
MSNGRILTIGYGGYTLPAILQQLTKAQVSYVIDVRSIPYSRHEPNFSREPLDCSLRSHGMKYVFMGDLLGGRPADADCYTDGKVDYRKTRNKSFFIQGISRLKNAYKQGFNICLLCSERHPSQCHRSKLIGVALSDEGIEVRHLLPDGSQRTQDEVLLDITNGQANLFEDHFVSRKTYR